MSDSLRGWRTRAAGAAVIGTGTTALISIAQAVLLVPLCLHYLGHRLYGAWLASGELLLWVQLVDLGLTNLMTQRVGAAIGRGEPNVAAEWFAMCVRLLAMGAALVAGAGLGISFLLPRWLHLGAADGATLRACFQVSIVASALLLVNNSFVALALGIQRTALVSISAAASAAVGIVVGALLLVRGAGLWALAIGVVSRAVVAMVANLTFLVRMRLAGFQFRWRTSSAIWQEAWRLLPATASANLAYLLGNHTDILLVTTLLRPELVAVYALTRKAADTLRLLLDTLVYAVHGGFAQLVASDVDRLRARRVLDELQRLRLGTSCVAAACFAALNEGFVRLLFGERSWGGVALTIAFAVQLVVVGQSLFASWLYRSTGAIRMGSVLFTVEAFARVSAAAVGLVTFGLIGAPVGSTVVSLVFFFLVSARLRRLLPLASRSAGVEAASWLRSALLLAAGIAIGLLAPPLTWVPWALCAAVLGLGGAAVVVAFDADVRGRLGTLLAGYRP